MRGSSDESPQDLPPARAWAFLLTPALGGLALHLASILFFAYGIFRDEYYYLACAERLAWGYVDHPPLSIALLAFSSSILGESLFALRLVPSLLHGVVILLVGLTARELGGGRVAQGLAGLVAALAPGFVGLTGFYSMNALDLALWAMSLLLLGRLARGCEPRRHWLALGVVLGLGLLNKLSVLYLGVGIAALLLLTPLRRQLTTPWPWASAALAFALFSPHLAWQAAQGWPTLEFVRNAAERKNVALAPLEFLGALTLEANPLYLPLWITAIAFGALSGRRAGQLWALVLPLAVIGVLVATGSAKAYYAHPALLALAALGGVAIERWLRSAWLRGFAGAYLALAGLALLPIVLPLLSPERCLAYAQSLGVVPRPMERNAQADLPQYFADRFGWEELAADVARVYATLSAGERGRTLVYARNYGQAGALEYFARSMTLPPVVSGHNSYWYWWPEEVTPEVVLVLGDRRERLLELFAEVELGTIKRCEHCMPAEDELPIWVCRRPKLATEEMRAMSRLFI